MRGRRVPYHTAWDVRYVRYRAAMLLSAALITAPSLQAARMLRLRP